MPTSTNNLPTAAPKASFTATGFHFDKPTEKFSKTFDKRVGEITKAQQVPSSNSKNSQPLTSRKKSPTGMHYKSESEFLKTSFDLKFKLLMDRKAQQMQANDLKDSFHAQIMDLLKDPLTIKPHLYYLTPLLYAYSLSLNGKLTTSADYPAELVIQYLEHFSQNILAVHKLKAEFLKHANDYKKKFRPSLGTQNSLRSRPSHNKVTLLFDLDETLIHSPTPSESGSQSTSIPIEVLKNIMVRPRAYECLMDLKSNFELGLFTSSEKEYADYAVKLFDPEDHIFDFKLYKESCIEIRNGVCLKDLRILGGREVSRIFLVDNNMFCSGLQLSQSIPIIPFRGSKHDVELDRLKAYLHVLSQEQNASKFNKRYFGYDIIQTNFGEIDTLPWRFLNRISEIVQKYS